ncbi:MAG: hypothetical protein K2Y71_30100 [Xanthobacteraceae bacterium]|nr:hypothetical protein [Xanthobacteraceae bacterium]MBX9826925.1 hypothetical protein [Xanthobacteraceae bacterium]
MWSITAALSNDIAVTINKFSRENPGKSAMILSDLSAAAAILVSSSGIARGRPQRVRSARDGANDHGHVMEPGQATAGLWAPRQGVGSRSARGSAML